MAAKGRVWSSTDVVSSSSIIPCTPVLTAQDVSNDLGEPRSSVISLIGGIVRLGQLIRVERVLERLVRLDLFALELSHLLVMSTVLPVVLLVVRRGESPVVRGEEGDAFL